MSTCNAHRRHLSVGVCGRLELADGGHLTSSESGLEVGEMCGKLRFTLGNTLDCTREAGWLWFALNSLWILSERCCHCEWVVWAFGFVWSSLLGCSGGRAWWGCLGKVWRHGGKIVGGCQWPQKSNGGRGCAGSCPGVLNACLGASNVGCWNVQRLTLDAGSCSVQHSRGVLGHCLWDFGLGWLEVVLGLGLGSV